MSIFKACDIRGVAGDDLTGEVARQIGYAIGTRVAGRSLAVGGDVRISTQLLKSELVTALVNSGCRVFDIGTVPTPTFYYFLREHQIEAGVMVTASHNPAKYNGFKVALGPLPVTEADMRELEELTGLGACKLGAGTLERVDVLNQYMVAMLKIARKPVRPLHIVIDAGNGCYSDIAPPVFRAMGYRVTELFCTADGTFPNREPNPAVAANLAKLQAKVKTVRADLGIAFDGDGDRVAFVDETGVIVPIDKSIVLFVRDRLGQGRPGKVVYDIKCSSIVPEEVSRLGGVPVISKSGHAFIKRTLIEERALLGGEISGHYFFDALQGDDGLYAALEMSCILAASGVTMSDLVADVPTYPITPDIRIPCAPEKQQPVLDMVASFHSNREVILVDGVRVNFPDGWGLVRKSVTEPLLTFRFEGRTPDSLRKVIAEFLVPVPGIGRLVQAALEFSKRAG